MGDYTEVKVEDLGKYVFAKGECVKGETRVSGSAPKGVVVLSRSYYDLTVALEGVSLADILEKAFSAPMTVASHRWAREQAETAGSSHTFHQTHGFTKGDGEKVGSWVDGNIKLTFDDLYPERRPRGPTDPATAALCAGAKLDDAGLAETIRQLEALLTERQKAK